MLKYVHLGKKEKVQKAPIHSIN